MAALIPMTRFQKTIAAFRNVLPFYEELPTRIPVEEAALLFAGLPAAGVVTLPKRQISLSTRFAAALSFREMAVFCRMLTLPHMEEEAARARWTPVALALPLKTYYLQIGRAHV